MRYLIACFSLLLLSAPAMAANCYSAAEAEAEQGIRVHSELMVIGLNCQHMTPAGWKNFYQEYREITNRHQDLFSGYEKTLIKHNKKNGGGAEKKMHNMRTSFANKVSADVAQMRPDVFCANYAPRIPKVGQMSRSEFKDWISTSAASQQLTKSVCR